MPITYAEMPVSFANHMFYLGQTNPSIVPDRGNLYSVSGLFKCGVISPIYHLAVSILCAPCGVIYHGSAALRERVYAFTVQDRGEQERRITLAWEHFGSALTDLTIVAAVFFPLFTIKSNFELFSYLYLFGLISEICSLVGCQFGWLFSSTVVAIPNAPEHLDEDPLPAILDLHPLDLGEEISKLWGRVNVYPQGCASYGAIRSSIYNNWLRTRIDIPETDPEILKNIMITTWKDSIKSAAFWAKIWPARPQECHLASSFSRPADQTIPPYIRPWEAVSLLAQAIAYAALGIGVVVGTGLLYAFFFDTMTQLSRNGELIGAIFSLIMFLFYEAAVRYQKAAKSYTNQHGSTECNFANQILEQFKDKPNLTAEQNFTRCKTDVTKALYWYKEAAMRGYAPAQYALGSAIFAALSYYDNVQSMEADDLVLLGEAVRWLQAAAINGDEDAKTFLNRCFQLTTTDRVYQGVAGESEPERVRQMFRFGDVVIEEDGGILKVAKEAFNLKYPSVGEKIQHGLFASKKEATARQVHEAAGLLEPLADVVASYCYA